MKNLEQFESFGLNEEAKIKKDAKHSKTGKSDIVDKIMAWEGGDMDDKAEIEFFQELIDNGMAWTLQGVYGRTAQALIDRGDCHKKK